jgi:hypothetical protein
MGEFRFPAPATALRKAAARATAFRERFFGFAETALSPLPALNGII